MSVSDPLLSAFARILRPLVRVLIARGARYPLISERLKEVYVTVAASAFRLDGKRVTDSRLSLLTGLQRKDVKALRLKLEAESDASAPGAGPLPRILALWRSGDAYRDADGAAKALPRAAGEGASFDRLVAEVSRDIHARTVLDELVRLGVVEHDQDADRVTLAAEAFLPRGDDDAMLGYLGANLGDHAEAATANVLSAPAKGPFFERAVHYNGLSRASLDELEQLARDLQGAALSRLNERASELQQRDREAEGGAAGLFRCGAFVYRAEREGEEAS